jgi:hypothetical protein
MKRKSMKKAIEKYHFLLLSHRSPRKRKELYILKCLDLNSFTTDGR